MLHDAAAVRERCGMVYRWVADGRSPHFTLDESRLTAVAGYVADVTRDAYPDLKIPYHSRWRHFSAGGVDRWGELAARTRYRRSRTRAHRRRPGNGERPARRRGRQRLALPRPQDRPCLHTFGGTCGCQPRICSARASSPPTRTIPCASIMPRLRASMPRRWRATFKSIAIIRWSDWSSAARCCAAWAPRWPSGRIMFGHTPARPGNLIDYLLTIADRRRISASFVLATLLESLSSIWPSGLTIDGFAVGDAGRHPAARTQDRTDRIVPFHKLSQWLTYSLLEPLEAAGLGVERLHELTALPEYRNGGLLVDLGVIRSRAADRSTGAPRGVLGACRRMARADGRADGPTGRSGEDQTGPGFDLQHAEDAAGRHLERWAQNRAVTASPGRSVADTDRRRRHGVLRARP